MVSEEESNSSCSFQNAVRCECIKKTEEDGTDKVSKLGMLKNVFYNLTLPRNIAKHQLQDRFPSSN